MFCTGVTFARDCEPFVTARSTHTIARYGCRICSGSGMDLWGVYAGGIVATNPGVWPICDRCSREPWVVYRVTFARRWAGGAGAIPASGVIRVLSLGILASVCVGWVLPDSVHAIRRALVGSTLGNWLCSACASATRCFTGGVSSGVAGSSGVSRAS